MEAVKHYADLNVCHEFMVRLKWPDGRIVCSKCGCDSVGFISTRRMYKCRNKACHKQFSVKVGTIFEDSPLGLDKWFVAVWCIANAKNGISSSELARALDVTRKSAWFMLHRVRHAMQVGGFQKFNGVCESDESYIGGEAKNIHLSRRKAKSKGRGAVGKAIVHGVLNRGNAEKEITSKVTAKVVKDAKRTTLVPEVRNVVVPGSTVHTDALASYQILTA